MSAAVDSAPVLELDDVHAAYGPFKALFGVSMSIAEGQAVALLGSNGAGKTTVARVATGLVQPTAGSVRICGTDVTGRPAHEIARMGIACAPEGRSVFASLSVRENLELSFGAAFDRSGVADAVTKAYDLFPKLGERRSQSAGSLSGGEQRMLTLARVLVLEPKLLIADELSLGLAPIITTEVYRVLEQIRDAGTALLMVEQHIDHAFALADVVVALDRGMVTFSGSPDELGEHAALGVTGLNTHDQGDRT